VEFLRDKFHQELDDDGEIVIAGETFNRHDILNGLAPEPYRIAFNEWLDERKERLLAKADEILKLYDNKQRFDRLDTAFEADKVMPFVGAGMSAATGYPPWTKFLYQLCDESHVVRADLTTMLAKGEYEEAAQLLHDDLGAALFNENLEATFAHEKKLAGAVNFLPLLFPGQSVITTNFDPVIERIYEDAKDTVAGFDMVKSGRSLAEVLRQMAAGSRLLIKLHGDCRQVAERVLLKTEYDAAYADVGAVKNFFNKVMFGQSLLFLGCSLSVDRTLNSMKEMVKEFGADALPRHYAILELKATDDRVARKKNLSEANIFPIWYEEGEHDESLEALFLKLMED
jgi:hypothetical protein